MKPPRQCVICHAALAQHMHWHTLRCAECHAAVAKERMAAIHLVSAAKRRGEIAPASSMKCVDCGAKAMDYDHRDYREPLSIAPVCRSCNLKRGPAMATRVALFS